MPRINPEALIRQLERLLGELGVCHELSRNQELTGALEKCKERVERIMATITANLGGGKSND
jgi:hypothetical protein